MPAPTNTITSPKIFLWAALRAFAVFLLLPFCIQGQLCDPVPSNLVSWWQAEGNASDAKGTNHGTLVGNTAYSGGQVGKAFSFDGSGDAVQIGNPASLQLQSFTIDAWIKRSSTTQASLSAGGGLVFGYNTGGYALGFLDDGHLFLSKVGISQVTSGAQVTDTNFHHVAVTKTGNTVVFYVDGAAFAAAAFASVFSFTSGAAIGALGGNSANSFLGLIDEIDVFNRALSASEVLAIYNAGATGKCGIPPSITSQPASQTVNVGSNVTFTVLATGTSPLSYQWRFNQTNVLVTATNASLTLSNVQVTNGGDYSVVVSNAVDSATSSNAVLTVNAPACLTAPPGLVSWWQGEGNANDSADSNNGVLVNGASFASGKVGTAFNFWGTNHVEVPAAVNLNVQSYTIEAWIFPADVSVLKPIVEYGDGGNIGLHLWHSVPADGGAGVSPGSLYANVGDAFGPYKFGTGGGVIPSNQWTYVALTYDRAAGIARLYVNGTNLATANFGSLTPLTALPVNLGYRPAGGTHFVGKMDEVSIYNRALAASEIQAAFNAGSAGKCDPSITSQPASQTVPVGADVTFAVVAAGTGPLSYRWYFNVTNLLATTNAILTLTNVQLSDAGAYNAVISNSLSSLTSSNATLTVSPPVCITASTGLVSWWQGEGNAADAADSNNGVLVNGTSFVPGRVGTAFNFWGTNHVQIPAAANLNVQSFTIEAWIFPADVNVPKPIVEYAAPTGNPGAHLWHSVLAPGSLYANVADAFGPYKFGTSAGVIPSNQWTHVALTYDTTSGVAQLFVNGTSLATANFGSITPLTALPMNLGYRPSGGSTHFVGKMDEVSIYNRALAAPEIQAIFNAASAGKCALPPSILTSPQSRTVRAGTYVTFNVVSTGSQLLSYQWWFNTTNVIAGATNSSLVLSNVQSAQAGDYTVVVSNSVNSVTSAPANLKVQYVFVFGNGQSLTNAQYSFAGLVTIQLQTIFTNGAILYTLDGSAPTFDSTEYFGPFLVTDSSILRVLTYSADFSQSAESDSITLTIIPTYSLMATTPGGGTVSLNPTNGPYASNTVVNVTATPTNGWTFLGWAGDASGTNTTIGVTMNRNKFVQALFGTGLGTAAAGNGVIRFIPSVFPAGGPYPFGTTVYLDAVPQTGSYFALWGNAASGNINPLSFAMTKANPTVSALFTTLNVGEFALTVIPNGFGQVTVNPRANRYTNGQNVMLTAVPDTGRQFIEWSGDATGTNNPLIVVMNQSKTIMADFTGRPGLTVAAEGLDEQGLHLMLTGDAGGHYRIDVSTNLLDWIALLSLTNNAGTVPFIDPSATNSSLHFYRAVAVP
ncbi:MAG: immunoglobulin domain-containing protein [Verrucomicrobia bacterium]|nr:immunoglobulin domain-containing protein [Verrucomicrobiota bacterium]